MGVSQLGQAQGISARPMPQRPQTGTVSFRVTDTVYQEAPGPAAWLEIRYGNRGEG